MTEEELLKSIEKHNDGIKDGDMTEEEIAKKNKALRRQHVKGVKSHEVAKAFDHLQEVGRGPHYKCFMCGGELTKDGTFRSKYCSSTCSTNARNLEMMLWAFIKRGD